MPKIIITVLLSLSLLTLPACGTSGPKYRNVRAYSEGLAPVQTQGGRWGFVNEKQEWVIQPKFEDAREFQGGKAAAKLHGKWGFVNKRGEWL
ncbi:MAG: WG repeat-containing protein [Betaproteobacteria bacterium]